MALAVTLPFRRFAVALGCLPRRTVSFRFAILLLFLTVSPAPAVSPVRIVVPDLVCLPGEEVYLNAYLYRGSVAGLFKPEIQGEVLRFEDAQGKTLDERLTDAAGMARIPVRPQAGGKVEVTVSLPENPRYESEPVRGRVFVRNPAQPLFFVVIEGALMLRKPLPFLWKQKDKAEPLAGSVEKTGAISRNSVLVYLSILPHSYLPEMRRWLDEHGFPAAPLVSLGLSDLDLLQQEKEPGLGPVEALWKDRSRPACLATGDPALARTAAGKGLGVFLVTPESEGSASYREATEGSDRITVVEEWEQIPAGCRGQSRAKPEPKREGGAPAGAPGSPGARESRPR